MIRLRSNENVMGERPFWLEPPPSPWYTVSQSRALGFRHPLAQRSHAPNPNPE